jgi:hypothetical protein
VKVGVWWAVSARRIVVPVFLMKLLRKISMYRDDSIFNTSCDLQIVTTSFQTLSAIRHADSLVKFSCASKQAPHSMEPWTHEVTKKRPCTYLFLYINSSSIILYYLIIYVSYSNEILHSRLYIPHFNIGCFRAQVEYCFCVFDVILDSEIECP